MISVEEHMCSYIVPLFLSTSLAFCIRSVPLYHLLKDDQLYLIIYYQSQIPSEASKISTQPPCLASVERANTRQILGESVDVLSSNQRMQMMGRYVMHVRIIEHITPV